MGSNRGIFGQLNQQVTHKVIQNKANNNDKIPSDEERQAIRELQNILASKNRKPCDCEAQVHELLENCLKCGRITCTAEGPGKCMYCENLILNERQRERLQKYIDIQQFPSQHVSSQASSSQQRHQPSTSARTLIIDRQFDQFSIDNTKHLRAVDRKRLKENLDELQGQKRQTKLLLHVDIDNLEAGSQSVPKIDDFEGEMRRLQLNYQLPNEIEGSDLTLAELVAKEAKTKYALEYIESVEQTRVGKHAKQAPNETDDSARRRASQNSGNQSKQRRAAKQRAKAQANSSNKTSAKGQSNNSSSSAKVQQQSYNSVAKTNKTS